MIRLFKYDLEERNSMFDMSYKRRHDNVARRVHWELCKKHGLKCSEKWYEHTPADVMENDEVELYWDLTIQTDMVAHNRPDVILVEKITR